MRIAVIGAGIAGLACARSLAGENHEVVVYEASPQPGGRIAAHRFAHPGAASPGPSPSPSPVTADHGARAFSVRFARFTQEAERWTAMGVAARWMPSLVSITEAGVAIAQAGGPARFVGTPDMTAPMRLLADELTGRVEFRFGTPVRSIHHLSDDWVVTDGEGGTDSFDAVATAVPAPQAVGLLTEVAHLHTAAARVPMSPAWSVAVRFADRLPIAYDAARVSLGGRHPSAGVLDWIDRESSKPGRPDDEVWVLHSSGQFAREHIHADPADAGDAMLDAFFAAVGVGPVEPIARHARLWKSAFPVAPLCDGCLYDESLRIGACGDWCMGARVEGAYLSGLAMADRLTGGHGDFLATCARADSTA